MPSPQYLYLITPTYHKGEQFQQIHPVGVSYNIVIFPPLILSPSASETMKKKDSQRVKDFIKLHAQNMSDKDIAVQFGLKRYAVTRLRQRMNYKKNARGKLLHRPDVEQGDGDNSD